MSLRPRHGHSTGGLTVWDERNQRVTPLLPGGLMNIVNAKRNAHIAWGWPVTDD